MLSNTIPHSGNVGVTVGVGVRVDVGVGVGVTGYDNTFEYTVSPLSQTCVILNSTVPSSSKPTLNG